VSKPKRISLNPGGHLTKFDLKKKGVIIRGYEAAGLIRKSEKQDYLDDCSPPRQPTVKDKHFPFFSNSFGSDFVGCWGISRFCSHPPYRLSPDEKINENLQKENEYFAEGLIKARGLADDLKVMQSEVLSLLKLKPKKKIPKYKGKGGYSSEEPFSLTEKGFEQNLSFLKTEVKERKEDLATIQKLL